MFRPFTTAFVLVLLSGAPAAAQGVSIEFRDGYVNLFARNATVPQILAEWARQGQTRVVNGDRVPGGPVTLELHQVPEKRALDTVLRGASGYVVAARTEDHPGTSAFARIMVMPPSTAARPAGPAPPPPQPMQPPAGFPGGPPQPVDPNGAPVTDDQDDPVTTQPGFVPDEDDDEPNQPAGPQQPGFVPGMRGGVDPNAPQEPMETAPEPPVTDPGPTPLSPGTLTSPAPGVLPPPQPPQPQRPQ